MPEPAQPEYDHEPEPEEVNGEHVDDRPLPVLAEVRPVESAADSRALEQARPVPLPVAVAVATGGFLLGVATFVLVRVLRQPRAARRLRGSRLSKRGRGLEVAGSRSFLVDVHLLKDR
ncbi:MAG TPA: hypothetical protein VI111_10485 [Thermoleophilaceae bacterium]